MASGVAELTHSALMSDPNPTSVRIEKLHERHPRIRAEDWRSPLIARLLADGDYEDGRDAIQASFRDRDAAVGESGLVVSWNDLKEDYEKCLNTYQSPVITEFAALAVACILCAQNGYEITEVTRRGDKVDYWLGDREALIEVSGTDTGNIEQLCSAKATEQLQVNPHGKDGFVCVAQFSGRIARLWFYEHAGRAA